MVAFLSLLWARFQTDTSFVPDLKRAVIYEVNLRAVGPAPAFKALTGRLKGLKSLGVNVIWLMPVQPSGQLKSAGGLGSPYAVRDYEAVSDEFGTPRDMKELVSTSHRLGMAVILDWVADHTAWDSPWIAAHPDWYLQDGKGKIISPEGTGWNDVAALNYNSQSMQRQMIADMSSWVNTYHVDGFRCDAADRMPAAFWKDAIDTLRASAHKRLLMLAEGSNKEDYTEGFDLTYGWDFCNGLRAAFGGKSADEVRKAAAREHQGLPDGALRLRFITNHDISAWEGSIIELYKTPQGARTAFTVMALYGGVPLIYNGQEVGWNKRIPIFDESHIDWSQGASESEWMASVLAVRAKHPAFDSGDISDFSTDDAIAFTRMVGHDQGLVIANVRTKPIAVQIPHELNGKWIDALKGQPVNLGSSLELPSFGCKVLVKHFES